tara:strand:+ start:522 stop:1481 length:960 start_codon:yes stop_codon:yes gene_type:complete
MSTKKVLITGGTGYLGKNLANKLKNDYEVILGARNNKLNNLASEITNCKTIPMDVVNLESVRDAINSCKPNIIIHAAATKFVDLAEREPLECTDVNVTGSANIARVAIDKNIETVIGVSTDKASPPVRNTYGLSKALMERVFCGLNEKSRTKFVCVRYGNVAWSTGSVLPIWNRMHQKTGIIGTTGPEMRRFFFTVDEAVQLVLTAIENQNDLAGKVLSRKMKAAKISDILDVWIEKYGGKWELIDGRPGERLDEYLIGDLELPYTQSVIYNNIEHYIISFNEKIDNHVEFGLSSENTDKLTKEEILSLIDSKPDNEYL